MQMPIKMETNKLLDWMWGNWESGLQKVYDSQQQMGKTSLEIVKKQQDLFTLVTTRLNQSEEEMKNNLTEMTEAFKDSNKIIMNEATLQIFENWNEKMTDIVNRIQQISVTPSKGMLTLVEQSHARMYEAAKMVVGEQTNMQTGTKEIIENFMAKVKESQYNLVNMMEEQTRETQEKPQPK